MATLSTLPTELLYDLAALLPAAAKLALSGTSRRFHALPPLHPLTAAEKLELLGALEHGARRACTSCVRLLPSYHFSAHRARGAMLPGAPILRRTCMRCHHRALMRRVAAHGLLVRPRAFVWLLGMAVRVCKTHRDVYVLGCSACVPKPASYGRLDCGMSGRLGCGKSRCARSREARAGGALYGFLVWEVIEALDRNPTAKKALMETLQSPGPCYCLAWEGVEDLMLAI